MSCCGGASFHGTDDDDEQKEALKRSTTATHLDQYLKGKKKGDKPGKKPRDSETTEEKQRYVYGSIYKHCTMLSKTQFACFENSNILISKINFIRIEGRKSLIIHALQSYIGLHAYFRPKSVFRFRAY